METMRIVERKTGKEFDCFTQMVDLNFNGRYILRYVIGIKNFQGFHNIECCYDNDQFDTRFEAKEKIR